MVLSLREGYFSKRIVAYRLLMKQNINYWEENLNESKPDIIHKLLNKYHRY